MNELNANGFYKRLHLLNFKESLVEHAASLPAIIGIRNCSNVSSLVMLRELELSCSNRLSIEDSEMTAKKLVNLKRVRVSEVEFVHIHSLFSSIKREICFALYGSFSNGFLDLATLNEERMKLAGVRNLMIYVDQDIFFATKWANRSTDFS